jgi:hypothetical protein
MLKMEHTSRGFAYAEFEDEYGQKCSIQKSSRMAYGPGDECIWIGVENPTNEFRILPQTTAAQKKHGFGWQLKKLGDLFPECESMFPDRMHLTQNMVKMLLPVLEHFAKTGELPE